MAPLIPFRALDGAHVTPPKCAKRSQELALRAKHEESKKHGSMTGIGYVPPAHKEIPIPPELEHAAGNRGKAGEREALDCVNKNDFQFKMRSALGNRWTRELQADKVFAASFAKAKDGDAFKEKWVRDIFEETRGMTQQSAIEG